MSRYRLFWAFVIASAISIAGGAARADGFPPEEEAHPPHAVDETCTVSAEESSSLECIECEIEHSYSSADYESCQREHLPWGYDLSCGDEWTEIWCREKNVEHPYTPLDDPDDGCSVALRGGDSFSTQLGLVVGLIALGLVLRRRFRR